MQFVTASVAALVLAGSALGLSDAPHMRLVKRSATAQPAEVANGIAEALASFQAANLIPKPIEEAWLAPVANLHVQYDGKDAALGSLQPVSDLQSRPTYVVDYAAQQDPGSAAVFSSGAKFTLMFIDASYNGDTSGGDNVTRHYLANGYTVNTQSGALENGSPVTKYAAPLPKAGDGPHRYMQLVWSEPATFKAPAQPAAGSGVESWDLASYVSQSGLGKIVALNYIQVQTGSGSKAQPTASVSSAAVAAASQSIAAALAGNASTSSAGTAGTAAPTTSKSAAAPGAQAALGGAAAKSIGAVAAVAFAGAWFVL